MVISMILGFITWTWTFKKKDFKKDSAEFKNIIKTLNFLEKCFPPEDGHYKYLSKH